MDWGNEEYVRVYTRDTKDLLAIDWEARALFWEMTRKADRSGVVDADSDTLPALVRMPRDVVERMLPQLLAREMVTDGGSYYFIPNYVEAQTANKSQKQRQRDSRANRAARAKLGESISGVTKSDTRSRGVDAANGRVTDSAGGTSEEDECLNARDDGRDVTGRDTGSRTVTHGHAESLSAMRCAADPLLCDADARARGTHGGAAWQLAELQVELRDGVIADLALDARRFGCVQVHHPKPIAELLAHGRFSAGQLEDALRSSAAEARGLGTVEYLDGVRNWHPDQVARSLAKTPEQAEASARQRRQRQRTDATPGHNRPESDDDYSAPPGMTTMVDGKAVRAGGQG